MKAVVADTHTCVWYLVEPSKLSKAAVAALDEATAADDPIYLASISLVEVRYLVDKGKLPEAVFLRLCDSLVAPDAALELVPLSFEIARAVGQIPKGDIPDMPDRIIAATALHLKVPLVTRDRKVQAAAITSIW
jgi:PIN domain nuclease of toxin-antitoxin system